MTGTDVSCDACHFCRWYIQGATQMEQQEIRNNPLCLYNALIFYKTFPASISNHPCAEVHVLQVGEMRFRKLEEVAQGGSSGVETSAA